MVERLPRPLLRGVRGAVSCGHPLAAAAGTRALAAGGTAVDAAVAAGMALSVLLPDACGLGGDALALLRTTDGRQVAFNGSGESPAAMTGPIPGDGGATVTAPGAVAALADLHARGGRLAWDAVLAPAVELAATGMPFTEDLRATVGRHRGRLTRRCPGWPVLDEGLRPGAIVLQRALAQSLRAIARDGPEAFYAGALAEATARAVGEDGGRLSVEDLARHRTVIRAPITGQRFGHAIRPRDPTIGAHTTAVATADGEGQVVSMLLSVFEEFGSGLLVAEGGFLLNDRAHGFTRGPNAPAPRARPVHTLSPAMARHQGQIVALCTPGADGQVQTLAQILTAVAVDGMSIPRALDQPRFRCGDGRLMIESDMNPEWQVELRARGHDVVGRTPGDPIFGAAACAGLDLESGTVFAASDPRRESWAAVL